MTNPAMAPRNASRLDGALRKAELDKMACAAVVLWALIINSNSFGQDLLRHVDLASPEMTTAEMTRADVRLLIEKGSPVDLSDRRLSGLDLSELNLRGANLRLSRLNNTNLKGADLSGAILDQAWALGSDFSEAKLVGAESIRDASAAG